MLCCLRDDHRDFTATRRRRQGPSSFLRRFTEIQLLICLVAPAGSSAPSVLTLSVPLEVITSLTACKSLANRIVETAIDVLTPLCSFSQPGPSIRAFCGSTPKDKNGNYVNGVNIKDMVRVEHRPRHRSRRALTCSFSLSFPLFQTTQAVGGLGGKAKMLGKPLGKKACLKFKVKHPAVIC